MKPDFDGLDYVLGGVMTLLLLAVFVLIVWVVS